MREQTETSAKSAEFGKKSRFGPHCTSSLALDWLARSRLVPLLKFGVIASVGLVVMAVYGRANIVLQQASRDGEKVDPRGSATLKGPEVGMTPDEIRQARDATGICFCLDSLGGPPSVGSCSLFMDARVVVSAAHVLDGRTKDEGGHYSSCYFQTQSEHPVSTRLDLRPGGHFSWGSSAHEADVALVKLDQPIRGAIPYQPESRDESAKQEEIISAADEVIMISGIQRRLQKPVSVLERLPPLQNPTILHESKEPIVQLCHLKDLWEGDFNESRGYYTDCSGTKGSSGSILLRRIKGHLNVVGIYKGSPAGNYPNDYEPYNALDKDLVPSFGIFSLLPSDIQRVAKRLMDGDAVETK